MKKWVMIVGIVVLILAIVAVAFSIKNPITGNSIFSLFIKSEDTTDSSSKKVCVYQDSVNFNELSYDGGLRVQNGCFVTTFGTCKNHPYSTHDGACSFREISVVNTNVEASALPKDVECSGEGFSLGELPWRPCAGLNVGNKVYIEASPAEDLEAMYCECVAYSIKAEITADNLAGYFTLGQDKKRLCVCKEIKEEAVIE